MSPEQLPTGLVRLFARLLARVSLTGSSRLLLGPAIDRFPLEVARALERCGLETQAIADICGVARRTAQARLRRSRDEPVAPELHRSTLRDKVLGLLCAEARAGRDDVTRADIEGAIGGDMDALARVLSAAVDDGTLYRAGRGAHARYRMVDPSAAQAALEARDDPSNACTAVSWALSHCEPATAETVAGWLSAEEAAVEAALSDLAAAGEVEQARGRWSRLPGTGHRVNIGADDSSGLPHAWPLSVIDHVHAVVSTLEGRLAQLAEGREDDFCWMGLSTYRFDVPVEADMADEAARAAIDAIKALGSTTRREATGHRERTDAWARRSGRSGRRVVFYLGQWSADG